MGLIKRLTHRKGEGRDLAEVGSPRMEVNSLQGNEKNDWISDAIEASFEHCDTQRIIT